MKNVYLFSIVFIGLGSLIFWTVKASKPVTSGTVSSTVSEIKKTDWVSGNKKSKAILVEYGDFQCPACANVEPMVSKLRTELGDKFLFIYRNFPLRQIHKNADA